MIGKGAKYLTAAGFGRYRITAASLGSNLMFVGSFWLNGSAIQAIMDAFGADGTAVIAATNEYLNGIAAQGQAGKAKATALAGFINEDPMMVCSLPLTISITMPTRRLKGDGVAYLHIPVAINTTDRIKIDITNEETASSYQPFFDTETYSLACWLSSSSAVTTLTGTEAMFNCSQGAHVFEKIGGAWYVDGVQKQTKSIQSIDFDGFWLYTWSGAKSRVNKGSMKVAIVGAENNEKFYGIPCKHNGQCGLYDIEGMIWYGNANSSGSFTIPGISYTPTP